MSRFLWPAHLPLRERLAVAATASGLFVLSSACFAAWLLAPASAAVRRALLHASLLAAFHLGEWLWSAAHEGERARWGAFLLDTNAPAYQLAVAASAAEWALGAALAPAFKSSLGAVSAAGGALAVAGLALRAAGMWRAGVSFAHLVAERAPPPGGLVTGGVYALFRHPAYAGWAYWAIGSQLLLLNPLCACAYTLAVGAFFSDRIAGEEAALRRFFGARYDEYARRTIVGIPLVWAPAPKAAAVAAAATTRAGGGQLRSHVE